MSELKRIGKRTFWSVLNIFHLCSLPMKRDSQMTHCSTWLSLSLCTVCGERWLIKASYGQLIGYCLCVVALWVLSNCCSSTLVDTCLWTSTSSLSPAAVTLVWLLRGYFCHFRPTSEACWVLPPIEKSLKLGLLWCLCGVKLGVIKVQP